MMLTTFNRKGKDFLGVMECLEFLYSSVVPEAFWENKEKRSGVNKEDSGNKKGWRETSEDQNTKIE